MSPVQTRELPAVARRRLLLGAAALVGVPLLGCGGGGGGDGGGGGGGGGATPSGSLVYRNSGVAAIYAFSNRSELRFDPRSAPFVNPGVAVSTNKIVTSAIEGDGQTYFDVGMFGLNGQLSTTLRMRRELSFQTGAAVFNADGSRLALSVDEPASALDDTRIARVVVLAMPSGQTVASIDGYEEPVWLGSSGELLVRDPDTKAMYVVAANLSTVTRLADLVSGPAIGAYSASADGRYIVYQTGASASTVRAYDRTNNAGWVAATDRLGDLKSPVLSPDGRFMAVLARDTLSVVPHVVSFSPNVTVAVENAPHALQNTLGECKGRMGWTS
jgi:hypothetical protein